MVRPVVSTSTAWFQAVLGGESEQLFQHFHHVIVGMLGIVQEHDIINRCLAIKGFLARSGRGNRGHDYLSS